MHTRNITNFFTDKRAHMYAHITQQTTYGFSSALQHVRAAQVGGCAWYNNVMLNANCHMWLALIWDHLPCG